MDKQLQEKQEILGHYTILAGLFDYPDSSYTERVRRAQKLLEKSYTEAGVLLKGFTAFIADATLNVQEELFTRSFEVQAATTLDIGYLLFGDDYKRAQLLVNLNREHNEVKNDCRNELADHLPNVLRLLPKIKEQELVEELADKMIAPALRKMIDEFNPERLKAKNKVYKKHHKTLIERSEEYGLIYQKPLQALYCVLLEDFNIDENEPTEKTSDFMSSVNTEMKLET